MAVAEVDYLNGGGEIMLKYDTFTATSDNNGNAVISGTDDSIIIIGAILTNDVVAVPSYSPTAHAWYISCRAQGTFASVTGASISGTYYYLEI